MKWLFALLLFASAVVRGQADDSTKYIWYKYQYGQRMPRIYADSIFRIPIGDTVGVTPNKGSLRVRITGSDTTIFFGTGLRWKAVGSGTLGGGAGTLTSITQGDGIILTPNPITSTGTIRRDTTGSNGTVTRSELRDSTDHITIAEKPIDLKIGATWTTPDTLYFKRGWATKLATDSSLMVDSALVETRAHGQKQTDSVVALINGTVSGINQLTGDVTAGPGTGSQPATIANNAVTNAKFRQSAGNSLVGKASSGTGNVADIAATIANTYFMFDGSTVKADSVNYGHIKNAPPIFPGMYIAPAQSFNPGFLVIATAIIRPSNSFSLNNPILYEILDNSTGHNYSFIDSAYGHASNARLVIRFPNVKNVLSMVINGDETFVANGLQIGGPSIASTNAEVAFYRPYTMGVTLLGDGTTTWTKVSGKGLTSLFTVDTYNTGNGVTGINIAPNYAADYSALHFQYIGPNGYSLRLATSGLGSFNTGFILQDQFGNAVLTPPTSSDRVVVSNAGSNMEQVGMTLWSTLTNNWMTSSANVWVKGFYEAWMVAAPASSTAIQVRYQTTVPSATSYKIYRSTSLYGAKTLVHTGTTGIFTDGSLTANTMYWYHMYATISGVDTYITYFRTNTYFN